MIVSGGGNCRLVVSSACILCVEGNKTECRYVYVSMSGGGCLLTARVH